MKLSNGDLQLIKDAATSLYKSKHFAEYDSELQAALCTIVSFVELYNRSSAQQILFSLEVRRPYESVDED